MSDNLREDIFNTSLQGKRKVTPGVSLFTAVKNRYSNLEEALPTWLSHPNIDEVIILDWDSETSIIPLVNKYQDSRIVLVEVKSQPRWILSFAYNLSARFTSRTQLLKIDADVKVLPGFFEQHELRPGRFFCGNWRRRRNDNELHLNGMVYLHREDFFAVNGYNEFIKFYGWDDSDLYQRLQDKGFQRFDFEYDTLYHIPHTGRTVHQHKPDYLEGIPEEERASLATLQNRHLGNTYGRWNNVRSMMQFQVMQVHAQHYVCHQTGQDQNPVSQAQLHESETVALRERIHLLDSRIPEKWLAALDREDLLSLYRFLFRIFTNPENRNDLELFLRYLR